MMAPPTSPLAVPEPAPRRLVVLLAEDNPVNALLATKHLERLGAVVTHAPDGLAALALAEAALDAGTPYDAMVLDIRMPGLDGLEGRAPRPVSPRSLARSVPRVSSRCPPICATGERRSASQAGIDAFLGKPISFDRLERALADVGLTEAAQ